MIVDLRSDTLTKPTPAMLETMMSAEVGDDVFNEDPTIHQLQDRVAEMLGKEAALFVASGTMANQLAIAAQTQPHDEIILDFRSHIYQYEQGAPAVISGVQVRPLSFDHGLPTKEVITESIRFPDVHQTRSRLLCLEVTHNFHGGRIPDYDTLKNVCDHAHSLGLKVHIDGARIWNAVVATGRPVTDFSGLSDTLMFCFSKGLGAPVGSILVGSKDTITEAHYLRKGLGGGWRQAGYLAAAGLHAIDHHIDRLAIDHKHAERIKEAIESNPNLVLTDRLDTNMIFFSPKDAAQLESYSNRLTEKGILNDWEHFNKIRLVTHLDISPEMIDYAVEEIKKL